jgi:hypothetical protein
MEMKQCEYENRENFVTSEAQRRHFHLPNKVRAVTILFKAKIRQIVIESMIFNCFGCRCLSFISPELLFWRKIM